MIAPLAGRMDQSTAHASRLVPTGFGFPSQAPLHFIMDMFGSHKGAGISPAIEAASARRRYLPPGSQALNPIENAFALLMALLRKEAARTADTLWAAIGRLINLMIRNGRANMFAATGYDPD